MIFSLVIWFISNLLSSKVNIIVVFVSGNVILIISNVVKFVFYILFCLKCGGIFSWVWLVGWCSYYIIIFVIEIRMKVR